MSYITTTSGVFALQFVVGSGPGRTLITRDAQHEYVFGEQRSPPDAKQPMPDVAR